MPRRFLSSRRLSAHLFAIALFGLAAVPLSHARTQSQTPGQSQATQSQAQPVPQDGGPGGDNGAIAIPRKNPDNNPPPPPPPPDRTFKNPSGTPNVTLQLNVPEVTLDVGVLLQKTHQFVPGLKPSNFRVYENGVPQKILGFRRIQAPITALMLCEFAARGWIFRIDMLNSAWAFAQSLRPQDYVAMMTFDLNTHIVSDFTQNRQQLQEGLNQLAMESYMPAAFSETDIFDALSEAIDRLSRIDGQKYIILIATGIDTMSKLTLDQILKKVKNSRNITIFSIATGGMLMEMVQGTGGLSQGMMDMTFLQAENQLRTFANYTGGMYFEPIFVGALPEVMNTINANIRSKYELVYQPTDAKQDGTWRKLHVELVDAEGHPLRMQDQKHHPLKYEIIARDGYRAAQQVE